MFAVAFAALALLCLGVSSASASHAMLEELQAVPEPALLQQQQRIVVAYPIVIDGQMEAAAEVAADDTELIAVDSSMDVAADTESVSLAQPAVLSVVCDFLAGSCRSPRLHIPFSLSCPVDCCWCPCAWCAHVVCAASPS